MPKYDLSFTPPLMNAAGSLAAALFAYVVPYRRRG